MNACTDEQEELYLRPDAGFPLGALGAWMALGLAASLIVLILIRQVWLWLA